MIAFARALEIIPRQISNNAGLDSTDVLNKLRMRHAKGELWAGVDVDGAEGVRNNMEAFVWEPSLVKVNAISSATEAACLILSVDETVRNPQSGRVCILQLGVFSLFLSVSAFLHSISLSRSFQLNINFLLAFTNAVFVLLTLNTAEYRAKGTPRGGSTRMER